MRGQRPNVANQLVRESLTDALFFSCKTSYFRRLALLTWLLRLVLAELLSIETTPAKKTL